MMWLKIRNMIRYRIFQLRFLQMQQKRRADIDAIRKDASLSLDQKVTATLNF